MWAQLFWEQVDSRQRAIVLYVGLAFLCKRAVVCGARYAVRVRERASTDALASFDIHGNRLKGLVIRARHDLLHWIDGWLTSCFFFLPYRDSSEGYKECSSDVNMALLPQVLRRTSSSVSLG